MSWHLQSPMYETVGLTWYRITEPKLEDNHCSSGKSPKKTTESLPDLPIMQMIPPIILAMYIFTQPESPRWLLSKAHKTEDKKKKAEYYKTVFQDLTRLRNSQLLAARDMILMHYRLIKEEELRKLVNTVWYRRGVYELFSKRRNRRAVTASLVVMFFQQFCGINVLIYYSTFVLQNANYSASTALLVSLTRFPQPENMVRMKIDRCGSGRWVSVSSISYSLYQPSSPSTDSAGEIYCL